MNVEILEEVAQDAAVAAWRWQRHRRRALALAWLSATGIVARSRVWRAADRMVVEAERARRAQSDLVDTLTRIGPSR